MDDGGDYWPDTEVIIGACACWCFTIPEFRRLDFMWWIRR